MKDKELEAARLPPGAGASFLATRHAGLIRVEALTARAEAWLIDYAGDDSSWMAGALILEQRYWPEFVDSAIGEGFTFEREAKLN